MGPRKTRKRMSQTEKISPELRARVAQLAPAQRIRVLVMLATEAAPDNALLTDARAFGLADMQRQTDAALPEIDALLARTGGQRLRPQADALGFLPVEISVAGFWVLADAPQVTTILENQSIKKPGDR